MLKKAAQFRDWLVKNRFFRVGWFAKDAHVDSKSEEVLSTLPDDLANQIKQAVNELPANPFETQAVLEPLEDAIAQWVENPEEAQNSIVILAQPVSPVSLVLAESISQISIERRQSLTIKLVDWIERPPHSSSIQEKLEKQLGTDKSNSLGEEESKPNQITIIPNLGWCFLRSTQGLNGIDYLQNSVMNSSQFVVIGCGQVGWEYLRSTLKFHAYCDQVIHLPKLTGKQLQEWIKPIVKQFDIQFNDAALHKRLGESNQFEDIQLSIKRPIETLAEITQEAAATAQSSLRSLKEAIDGDDDDDESASPRREYFDRLADISDGVSTVALQLFIRSLRYRKAADLAKGNSHKGSASEDTTSEGTFLDKERRNEQDSGHKAKGEGDRNSQNAPESPQIIAQLPKLPPLPDLSQTDLYLLYSLMLHGDLTISSLAESLGDAPQIVNNQVQILRNEGIIEQKDGVIKTNPIHYPRLRKELANNNFIIEVS